jgi:hypothetical protein
MNSYGVRPPEGFEPPGEVVGVNKIAQMSSRLIVASVEVRLMVTSLMVRFVRLAVRPGMLGLDQPMIDIIKGAGVFEGMRDERLCGGKGAYATQNRPRAYGKEGAYGTSLSRLSPI